MRVRLYDHLKRLLDLGLACIALLILLPLLGTVALAIKLSSSGPVFYRGIRTGFHGNPFHIFKFRTMVIDAESTGPSSTAKDDPRVTRIGRLIRRYKIDELPQLLNIVAGDMSFVGPRPELPQHTQLYNEEEQIIFTVRPGITDYSSLKFIQLGDILGNEDPERVYEERVRPVKNQLRVQYVRDRSLSVDLRLVLMTLLKLGTGRWNM